MSTTNFSLIFRLLNLYLKFSNQSQSNWGFYSYNKKTLDKLESFFTWLRPNLPGGFPPSTFSAKELNFCVRNGNRCILLAIVTTLFN